MTAAFAAFRSAAASAKPRVAVVLGSCLGPVLGRVAATAEVSFADIPGFPAPTVKGHAGRVVLGTLNGVTVVVFQGRAHGYEGNPPEKVTAGVRLAAELGAKTLVLTNAAGGIRADLNPGDLMAIRGHFKWLGRDAWKAAASGGGPYSPRLVSRLTTRGLPAGVYAALTGPCYETPAEIRALAALGADAVGMSTAVEAEAAAALGLEVAAISCVTNKAAGLSPGPLDHKDVLATAAAPADRLANLLADLVVEL